MKPSIYPVVADHPGQLFIMPKPSGEWLQEDMQHYRSLGVDMIISMLETTEANELSLHNENDVCTDNSMKFLNFPITDRGLPDKNEFKELVCIVQSCLTNGEGIAVHCRAGIGRSGMLVCCALAGFIGSASDAIEVVSQARGVTVPDTQEQRMFIESIVQELMT
ncbi:hypothetical protein MNBD_ALPHA07-970 [hydrothermal vent metagenome]|uniref:Tyrosine specific protein phosphatases domain-containing protein n=1 Tax=hydrothermal vent metagenome TaxID=652676 RepID=A0A3B0SC19_9ZZZZ